MRKSLMLCGLLLFAAGSVMAQEYPKAEIAGNYTYIRIDAGGAGTRDCHGGGGSATYNLTSYLGIAADFAGCKVTGLPSGTSASALSYLFGPRIKYRGYSRLEPFGEFLFGGAHDSITGPNPAPPPTNITVTDNAFSFAVGGGVDYKLSDRFAIRLGPADYLYTKFGSNTHQNNARIQAGIVFRWGGR